MARYFPGAVGFAIVGINPARPVDGHLGAWLLGAYAFGEIMPGAFLMQRRDIT